MRSALLLMAFLSLAGPAPAQAVGFGEADPGQQSLLTSLRAYAAYKIGDYATAHRLWLPLAEDGNTTAMVNIANLHIQGQGVPADACQARLWLERARARGDERADEILLDLGPCPSE